MLCRSLEYPKMTIEIKNITVGSLFEPVCAGLRWSALKVFYNLNVPGYMNIKKNVENSNLQCF